MSSFFRKKKPIITPSQHHHTRFYHEQKWDSIYECYGCHQPGSGPYCSCNYGCNLYYHPRCSELLSSGSSSAAPVGDYPPYSTGYLVLKETAPRTVRSCVACGYGVRMLRYKWRHKKAYGSHGSRNPYWALYRHLVNRAFHPRCASLPPQIERIGQHRVVLHLTKKIRGKCLLCRGNSKGWAYNSTCWNYCCHVGCMMKEIYCLQQNSGKSKLTIYLKKAWGLIREIVIVALLLIVDALLGFTTGIWQSIAAGIAAGIVGAAIEVLEL